MCLVSLKPGLAGYIVPSKLYPILAAGRPYIAAVEPLTEVAALTERHRCGVLVDAWRRGAAGRRRSSRWPINRGERESDGARGRARPPNCSRAIARSPPMRRSSQQVAAGA